MMLIRDIHVYWNTVSGKDIVYLSKSEMDGSMNVIKSRKICPGTLTLGQDKKMKNGKEKY